jgi:hypothetical protein
MGQTSEVIRRTPLGGRVEEVMAGSFRFFLQISSLTTYYKSYNVFPSVARCAAHSQPIIVLGRYGLTENCYEQMCRIYEQPIITYKRFAAQVVKKESVGVVELPQTSF